MKYAKFIAIICLAVGSFSCNSDDESTQEQDLQNLIALFAEIDSMIDSETCTDASDWRITDYGSKACGGPSGYIAYPITIDTELFLEKIAEHRMAQQRFNERWGVVSDCAVIPAPSTVRCENGKPVLE